jgi:hypothetical protein
MTEKTISGWITWLKGWFYDKTEINTLLNAKVNLNQSQANKNVVTNASGEITTEDKPTIDSAMSSSSTNAVQNKVVNTALGTKVDKTNGASQMTDTTSSFSNLGTLADRKQSTINTAIDTKIGEILGIEFVKVVQTRPTASADTMNKLYVVTGTSSSDGDDFIFYVTVRSGTSPNYTYAWEVVDDAILKGYITQATADERYQGKIHVVTSGNQVYASDYNGGDIVIWYSTSIPIGFRLLYVWESSPNVKSFITFYDYTSLTNTLSSYSTKANTVKDIELVPKATDATGAIKLIYADQ